MADSDLFGVKDPVSGQIGYCCVLGAMREVFALCVYRGSEGLDFYLRLGSGDLDPELDDIFAIQDVLMAEFVNKTDMEKEDLKVVKSLGLKFRGNNNYPSFRSHLPGYYPWHLTQDEAIFLTLALECACDLAKEFKDNPDILEPPKPEHFLTYLPNKGKDGFSLVKKWQTPKQIEDETIKIPVLNQLQIKKIRKMNLEKDSTWEADTFYSTGIVNDEDRPYWMRVSLVVHHEDGFILQFKALSPEMKPYIVVRDCILDAIEKHSTMPEEIIIKDEALFVALKPLADIFDIAITFVDELPAIMEAKRELSNMPKNEPKKHRKKKMAMGKYKGDKHLENIIKKGTGCTVPIHEVRACILGNILAIDVVSFNDLFDKILRRNTPDEIVFKNQEQAQEFSMQIMSLWNSMLESQKRGEVPPFKPLPDNLGDSLVLLEALECRSKELDLFLGALAGGSTSVGDCPDEDATEVLEWLEKTCLTLKELIEDIQKESDDETCFEGKRTLEEIDYKWEKFFFKLEEGLRRARGEKISAMRLEAENPKPYVKRQKVGRNAPCPCGSGKKYKKCCGIVH